jgi:thioredoxin reductase
LGLAHQRGNKVTLSYRKEAFSRIKERNAQRIAESAKSGKVQVIFNSQPLEILPNAVRLEVAGATREIANDWVWVFAGGTPPNEFLGKVGVQIGPRDLTAVAGAEAKLVSGSRRLAG